MWQTTWTSRCLTAHTLALSHCAVITYLNMTADGGEPLSGDADFEGGPNNCCSPSAALHCLSSCENTGAVGLEMISTGTRSTVSSMPCCPWLASTPPPPLPSPLTGIFSPANFSSNYNWTTDGLMANAGEQLC